MLWLEVALVWLWCGTGVALVWCCCGLRWLWYGVGVALLWRVWLLHVVAIVADVPLYLCIVSFSFV